MLLERLKIVFIFAVILYSQGSYASLVDVSPTMKYTTGHVGAVGLVTDANDNPILAEFGSDGLMVRELGPYGVGDFKNVTILSASAWRAMQDLLTTYLSEHGENGDRLAVGATLMSVAQYNSLKLVTNTRDSVEVTKPVLKDQNSKSVLLIAEQKILTPHPPYEAVVLMEFPVDLSTNTTLANDTVSLVVNDQGQIVLQSQYDVSYKVEYYKDKEAENGFDRLWAPVNGMSLYGVFGSGASFPDGKYTVIEVWPSCPKFSYTYDAPLTAKVYYSNFNPKTPSGGSHYIPIVKNGYVFCSNISGNLQGATDLTAQMAGISASSIEGSAKLSANKSEADFQIPVMELLAIGQLENVELGSVTEYQSDDTAIPVLANGGYRFDFDGDGKTDLVVSSPTDANKVDIYLGGRTEYNELDIRNPPDLTRLADSVLTPQLQHQGLLKTITKEDLEDTDIYIYREATGQLLSAVEGLSGKADDIFIGDGGNVGGEGSEADFSFTTLIVSQGNGGAFINEDERFNKAAQASPWKTSAGIGAGFKDGGQDFLRVGETVNIIAINRKTGYIGSKKTRLTSLNAGDMGTINDIVLRPPNLKVIATRTFEDTAGLTKGEQHNNQLIGSEGAGLTSDDYVKIQTVWLAEDGSVLPETLPGYTGRLAVSTGNSTKDFSGNFEIKPGYQTQIVQLNNDADLTTEHFYVQVIGENFDGNPSFASPGAGPGKLQTRPAKYVPIKVPIFNELATIESQNALREAKQQSITGLPDEVDPVYHWVYRPEMQFSVFDFQNQQMQLTSDDDSTQLIELTRINKSILGLLLNEDLSYVNLLYDLTGSSFDPLTPFGSERELVFSIGVEESLATVTSDGVVRFEKPEHINQLTSTDYLTISLYQSNDAANVLWEYAFGEVRLVTPNGDPETQPVDHGDGQNEFTFDSSSPGILVINFKAKVLSDSEPILDLARRVSFGIEDVGSSPAWSQSNPEGRASVYDGYLVATASFIGLPISNNDFGKKIVTLKMDGHVVQRKNIEVFFNKNASNSPSAQPGLPNWFYYWRDGDVCGIPSTTIYDPGADFGYVLPGHDDFLRLGPFAAMKNTGPENYISKLDGNKLFVTGQGMGISSVAETVEHELHHLTIYNSFLGMVDTDGDGIADVGEANYDNISTSITDPDTYGMASFSPGYINYGDNEIRARFKELNHNVQIYPEKDWANPGSQTVNKYGP